MPVCCNSDVIECKRKVNRNDNVPEVLYVKLIYLVITLITGSSSTIASTVAVDG
jgi:hypothetical protein